MVSAAPFRGSSATINQVAFTIQRVRSRPERVTEVTTIDLKIMKEGYKRAHYREIPCFFNPQTNDIEGRNWFYDKLIEINIWFDFNILWLEELPIWVETDE